MQKFGLLFVLNIWSHYVLGWEKAFGATWAACVEDCIVTIHLALFIEWQLKVAERTCYHTL